MDSSSPSLRERGLQALRAGDVDGAVDFLARAVMADGQDAESQAFLGVAYSQKGLHAQAKRALQTAVDLQPGSASFRFNLGVALEMAADRPAAAEAYRQTLEINPEHQQAKAKLQSLAASVSAPPAAPPSPSGGAIAASPADATWLGGGQAPATAAVTGPPGTVPCPQCRQWSKPGLSCEWCSAPLKSAPAPAAAPWLQGSYGSGAAMQAPEAGYSSAPDMGAGEAFGRRFGAYVIDSILLSIVSQVLFGGMMRGALVGGAPRIPNPAGMFSALLPLMGISFLIYAAYYGGMLALRGQTLGKMALGVRVIGPDGGNPSFLRALLREIIGKWISGLVLCLGYLWMLWDEGQQTWHDKIAGTYVERA